MMIKGSPRTIAMQEMEINQLGWSGRIEGCKDAPNRVTERISVGPYGETISSSVGEYGDELEIGS